MKKFAVLLAALLVVSMLGGCYKADTTVKVNPTGNVTVTSTLVATKNMYELAGIESPKDLVDTFSPEVIDMYSAMYGLSEKGTRLEMVAVDANGAPLADPAKLPGEGEMAGARLSMKYDSFQDAASSFTLSSFLLSTPIAYGEGAEGIVVEEDRNLFGTKYIGKGKISVHGTGPYKNEYDLADKAQKDMIAGAAATISFKFPASVSKSNADTKGFLGGNLSWTVTPDAPEKDVYFEVTTINPIILGMGIVILILAALLIIMAVKNKKKPAAFYVDEDGNEIPVFDEEGVDEEAELADEADLIPEEQEVEAVSETFEESTEMTEEEPKESSDEEE